jgi:predicted RND superfamily exporter protein
MVNDGLVLIGKFNNNLREGMTFDDAIYDAGRSRFRAIFLTSITTIAGLAPLILEQSRQAQFLIPMAISIAYGIAFATVLTLVMLPIFLSFSNKVKVNAKWLATGNKVAKEDVERAIKEQKEELDQHNQLVTKLIKESPKSSENSQKKEQTSIELEGKAK